MANEEEVCRVLDEGATRESLAKALGELGLVRQNVWEAAGEKEAYEEVWSTPDKTRAINYVEDPLSGMSYVCLRGANVTELTGDFLRKVSCFWPEELLEVAYDPEDENEQVDNLYRLAITFPEYDEQVFEIFEGIATNAPQAKLRLAALDAMGYHTWPESRAVVERVAREDDDAKVKLAAKRILPLWDAPPEQRT
jgi:hypothetical protein